MSRPVRTLTLGPPARRPTPELSGRPGLVSNVRDPDVALVWGSLSLLEKFSSPNQQGAIGVPMSECFGRGAVGKRGS